MFAWKYRWRSPVIKLPLSLIKDRVLTGRPRRNPFVQQATWFEDIVVRCVRYAFAFIPARIGRVFFSKMVALPFLRFRMLRHGYFKAPIHWQEIKMVFSIFYLIIHLLIKSRAPSKACGFLRASIQIQILSYSTHTASPQTIKQELAILTKQVVASQWALATSTSNSSSHC